MMGVAMWPQHASDMAWPVFDSSQLGPTSLKALAGNAASPKSQVMMVTVMMMMMMMMTMMTMRLGRNA